MAWNIKTLQETLLIGSTLVEGSTLTESEAREVFRGKTIQGHSITEVRELLNYKAAVEWLVEQVKKSPYISCDLILGFHAFLFQGFPGAHGRWKSASNFTYLSDGSRYDYASPQEVPDLMLSWVEKYNAKSTLSPEESCARLYYEFQQIHPFEDGNGRIGRILCSYWFGWKFNLNFKFYLKDKIEHLQALEAANRNDFKPLVHFLKKRVSR